jgi:hypothetical protein
MDTQHRHDPEEDEDYDPVHEEWVPLGHRVWLILYTWPDGNAEVTWAIQHPDGPGFTIHLGF